jgi:hypothetical protein
LLERFDLPFNVGELRLRSLSHPLTRIDSSDAQREQFADLTERKSQLLSLAYEPETLDGIFREHAVP